MYVSTQIAIRESQPRPGCSLVDSIGDLTGTPPPTTHNPNYHQGEFCLSNLPCSPSVPPLPQS